MKKLLAVFDGAHFSEGALHFAARLNEYEPVLLVGVFLPAVDYSDAMVYYLGGMAGPLYLPEVEAISAPAKEDNTKKFEAYCKKNNIEYRLHTNAEGHVIDTLKTESRFADLLIISNELFYENLGEDNQNEYLTDTMHKAECPVLLVPEHYEFPKSVIVAYDGSASSVFALKQFAYLFPEFADMSTLIVYVTDKGNDFPNMAYIEELGARHFKDLTFFKLETDPKKYFNTWLSEKGSALLVSGAYGRSGVSELFKKNFTREVVNEHKLPIFIAHF